MLCGTSRLLVEIVPRAPPLDTGGVYYTVGQLMFVVVEPVLGNTLAQSLSNKYCGPCSG